MSKIAVDKCVDDKDSILLKIPKESVFYHFLMEGEFDNADKKLYREVREIRRRIRGI